MNRKEAKDEAWSYAHAEDVEHVQKLVDIIYDDLESRTCENCKLRHNTESCPMRFDDSDYGVEDNTEDNGYCSYWEAK